VSELLNVRRVAGLLNADAQLEDVERSLKRGGDWRAARKIGDVRETLRKALWEEQLGLHAMLVEFVPAEESRE
jgi:hypothetical protein